MAEFTLESEAVDVERIMAEIRRRIQAARDAPDADADIAAQAAATFERFFDLTRAHASVVEYYRQRLEDARRAAQSPDNEPLGFTFDPETLYRSSRGALGGLVYRIRKLLNPILKCFVNPTPIGHALTMQQRINARNADVLGHMVRTHAEFVELAALNYDVMHQLVVEMTRLSVEMKNHALRVESVAGRLDFEEYRRSRQPPPEAAEATEGEAADGAEKKRRRRRRGRRRPAGAAGDVAAETATGSQAEAPAAAPGDAAEPVPAGEDPAPAAPTGERADS